ncbi:MAG: hypothetical protein EOM52_08465 [Clostridia bacterium]|nr:hypothetical protein [Clostridia bacterium]
MTPYEGDFLVEVSDGPGDTSFSLLYWIFGGTGRSVQLNGICEMLSVTINGRGVVTVTDSGVDWATPRKGLPGTSRYRVIGDENGRVDPNYAECLDSRETTWLDPAEPLYAGWWDGENGGHTGSGRYEQVYDARMDADGLSFSFIPQGGSAEDVGNFIAACTTTPSFDTSFDAKTRIFTLRLYHVSLSSGKKGESYEGVRYPYEFPAGSLGKDGHFMTDAQIKADGEDAVVSFRLTDRAYRFTVESGNLGYDNIPMLRLIFRERNSDLDH